MATLVEYLFNTHSLGFSPQQHTTQTMVHSYYASTWEVEAGGSAVQDHLGYILSLRLTWFT